MTDGLLGAAVIRTLAAQLDITPTKKLGQNFVIDPNTVRWIVDQSRVNETDTVIEIGPGLGSLTLGLLPHVSHVIAVEIDDRLAAQLPLTVGEYAPQYLDRLTVIHQDALTLEASSFGSRIPTALVANLPYNISVPVLLHALTQFPSISQVLVMVQKEVADRMCAQPGSKVYGIPSVKIAWFGSAETAGNIGKHVFWPAPNVDSGLVRITRHPKDHVNLGDRKNQDDRAAVFTVIDAAFAHRRKTLRAGLALFLGSASEAEKALVRADINPRERAENLDLDAFIRLSAAIAQLPE